MLDSWKKQALVRYLNFYTKRCMQQEYRLLERQVALQREREQHMSRMMKKRSYIISQITRIDEKKRQGEQQ